MQTVTPVDVHVENEWRNGRRSTSYVRKSASTGNRGGRQAPRVRICVATKTKTNKTKTSNTPQQVVQPKPGLPARSRSPSPNRDPWVPPPGRSTKGQRFVWQSPKARLEITPVVDNVVHDDVDDESNIDTERGKQNQTKNLENEQKEKVAEEIQSYEKRIQGLIEGVGMLKERAKAHCNQEQTDQLRSDINSCLRDLEQSQQRWNLKVTNACPSRISRSSSVDERRNRRSPTKISFQDDSIIDKRRARSTTPVRGPLYLNPDRERLLISLSESEADIAQITKQLSSVKDILTKLKLENQPVSFEIDQLNLQRNQLLRLIEHFENSNNKLKDFLREQYHLEAEHGIRNQKSDGLLGRVHELENENAQIRRLLLEREKDNIALQNELERVRTHAIGFDTMKTSLEHNRAHLQRELYAKEGEINRLQCLLRSLERDLQRSRFQCDNLKRAIQRTPMYPHPSCSSPPSVVAKTKDDFLRKPHGSVSEQLADANAQIAHLSAKLEHAERLIVEYKEQLHTQSLKTSLDNSKVHISEVELEKMRIRLQKRIEELEPLPELLRQAEMKNQELQTRIIEQEKCLAEQAQYISELSSKKNVQSQIIDRMKESHYAIDDDHRVLHQKIDALQRQLIALEDENATLVRNLNAKDDALRNAQSRLNTKVHELTTINKQINTAQADLKARDDTYSSKERVYQQRISELEQYLSKLRLECTQLKREKEEGERRFTSQLGELRDKLEQSNNNNRSMQNYVNSLKTTYASVFNDTIPPPFTATSFSRFSTTPNAYP